MSSAKEQTLRVFKRTVRDEAALLREMKTYSAEMFGDAQNSGVLGVD